MADHPFKSPEPDEPDAPQPAEPVATPAPVPPQRGGHDQHGPEVTIWEGRPHWHHSIGRIVLGVLAAIVAGWLISVLTAYFKWTSSTGWTVALLVIIPILAFTVGTAFYRVLQSRYRLTGQRLFITRGIISQTIDQTELIRVDDVRVHKQLVDRVFGMGTVEIRSTDATDGSLRIEGVKNADHVAELVRNSMRALRNKSLFIENL